MRDEVDLMMRLRIPWRERMGARVNEKGRRRMSQTEMEVQRKKKARSQKRFKGGGNSATGSESYCVIGSLGVSILYS